MLQVTRPSTEKKRTLETTTTTLPMPSLLTGNESDFESISYRNCIGCGFIYTKEEYEKRDHCGCCNRPLSSKARKENRRRRDEGEDEQGLAKAEALRERLVRYDRESSARSRITDDDQA